jgi:putative ATPase
MDEILAIKLRPNTLKEMIGQEHLIGKDKVIYNLIKNNKLFSMILYGSPGTGKTSLANVIVKETNVMYRELNAVINSKKDFDIVIEEAKLHKGMVVIVDEIHRMNKDKQDLLLPHLESGLIKLIGLTTSNPYYVINPAIRSRVQIYKLEELTKEDIIKALKSKRIKEYLPKLKIDKKTIEIISNLSGGDLRYAYNLLEVAYYSTSDGSINEELILSLNNKPNLYGDSNGDNHYDLLSAFQKSIRGSDVDAALYYLGRLIIIGDIDAIYRRMSVICYEDIGLANPMMGVKINAIIETCNLVGFPEARIPLSVGVIEMCLSPKSNSAYEAISNVINDINNGNNYSVPNHIKNGNPNYLYPHNYPNSLVKQTYLPAELLNKKYYYPKDNSSNEKKLKEIYNNIKKMND